MKTTKKHTKIFPAILAVIMIFGMMINCVPFSANDSGVMLEADAFSDVTSDKWYYEAVTYCAGKGIFNGTGNGIFSPDKTITRGEFVKALANYSKDDYSNEAYDGFADVTTDKWFYSAVAWAKNNSVVSGVSDTEFGPDKNITRQELCTMLYRFIVKLDITVPEVSKELFADDSDIASWSKNAVYTIKACGIVNGKTGNVFDPEGKATRAEAAQMMMKFDKYVEENSMKLIVDEVDIKIEGLTTSTKFLHISDLHLTLWDETDTQADQDDQSNRREMFDKETPDGVSCSDRMGMLYKLADKEKVDAVLMTGDIVDSPTNANIKFLNDTVKGSLVPSIYCLGNHDWTSADADYYQSPTERNENVPKFKDIFSSDDEEADPWDQYVNVYEYDGFIVVSVDNSTNQVPSSYPLTVVRSYSRRGTPIILMLHVPVTVDSATADISKMWGGDITMGSEYTNADRNTRDFVDFLKSADSTVVAILAGHTHIDSVDDLSPNNDTVQYTLGASYQGYTRIFNIHG